MKLTSCCRRKISGCDFVKMSSLFMRSPHAASSELKSTSQKLMHRHGLVFPAATGTLYLLPLFVRALEKLVRLVDHKMQEIGAQKMIMPTLTSGSLFEKSGRWDYFRGSDLFKLKDRHDQEFCLGPTHEESVTNFIANYVSVSSYRSLPVMLYQITTKFRDEIPPRFGAIRSREFLMKDLYTFDQDESAGQVTYDRVCRAYSELFELLDVPVVKVKASSGEIGGIKSDEYHILSDIGKDMLVLCNRCNYGVNKELQTSADCPQCNTKLESKRGIEVGQAFLLGTKYSEPFQALYTTEDGSKEPYYMGCYGLGMTRILAAVMEVLSKNDEAIRWPFLVSPFLVGIVPPKKGIVEMEAETMVPYLGRDLCNQVSQLSGNILLDDRSNLTIGRRVNGLKDIGIPFLIVLGKKVLEEMPRMEVIDVYRDETHFLTYSETLEFFRQRISNWEFL